MSWFLLIEFFYIYVNEQVSAILISESKIISTFTIWMIVIISVFSSFFIFAFQLKSRILRSKPYSLSSMKIPTITARGTERTTPQKPITTAPINAETRIKMGFIHNCFSIRNGVMTLFCSHWTSRKTKPTISMPRSPLWIRARITIGIKAKSGPT